MFNLKFSFIVHVHLKDISFFFTSPRVRVFFFCIAFKMNLTSLFITNLISMSNLTFFLDRLITDGKYKTVFLTYDDASIKDNNFVSQLVDLAFEKYAMMITEYDSNRETTRPFDRIFFLKQSDILQIIMVNYREDKARKVILGEKLRGSKFKYGIQNVVVLFPIQSNDRKEEIWEIFGTKRYSQFCKHMNVSVIFYETENSKKMTNTLRKSMEIFVFNYKAYENVDIREINVESNHVNESNLYEKIFGSIVKEPILSIRTETSVVNKSVTKISDQRGNDTIINLGSAEYYLSNFIARNLRSKHSQVQQILQRFLTEIFDYSPDNNCSVSNEKYYGELYNKFPENLRKNLFRKGADSSVTLAMSIRIGFENKYHFSHSLYPHDFDDMVFIIFQHNKLKSETSRTSIIPISQWFAIISIASLIICVLRKISKRFERQTNDNDAAEHFLYSFVDAVAVFLGTALQKFGNCRAERWFLVSFAIFGIIFKIIYTDSLFVMFIEPDHNRITSIDQLIQANIPITAEFSIKYAVGLLKLQIGS